MFKKLIGVFIMTSQLTTAAYSHNSRRLELEADECTTKIWAGIHLKGSQIREHLNFLSDAELLPEKYTTQVRDFTDFYERAVVKVLDPKLSQFTEDCKIVYEESELNTTKAGVLMLLEKVAEKYAKSLKKVEKAKAMEAQTIGSDHPDPSVVMKAFFNADRDITVN